MKPINSIEEAKEVIEACVGNIDEFELPISDEMQDVMGMNMAIILDGILAKGYEPDGFLQKNGYRIYLYRVIE